MPYHTIANGITTVDCQKQVRSWRILRSLIALLVPSCSSIFVEEEEEIRKEKSLHCHHPNRPSLFTSTTITGTIFGFRRGKVSFCIQTNPKSNSPLLVLEFSLPTAILAREMQAGILRIALECSTSNNSSSDLLATSLWTVYCNGRKAGYAAKRRPSKVDMEVMKKMNSVNVGAGIIRGKEFERDDELMYLRAKFARVCGSSEAESFHLIDPDGCIGQELSIFFFRSR
ncbi:protein MIZU-KUSSEI 1 [Mercurialis annua]|uniref:protein MIZU-KUSSEI 1 n=1 Tax=Mercurialis annua TaxID=3986 RepID=UPI0021606522|nr:protein MIZU-KUSSEI 1 [Mercurialis annua]